MTLKMFDVANARNILPVSIVFTSNPKLLRSNNVNKYSTNIKKKDKTHFYCRLNREPQFSFRLIGFYLFDKFENIFADENSTEHNNSRECFYM